MNTEMIIKALEWCLSNKGCYGCPYEDESYQCDITKDSLALIKELQAHNETLKKENKYLRESLADEREHKEDMKGK